MIGWKIFLKNWVHTLFNDRMDKLFNNLRVPYWTCQIQIEIMIKRDNLLSVTSEGPRKVEEKRPVLRRSKHVLFMKKQWNMTKRRHTLSAVPSRTRTLVFVNWSRRSRITLADSLFNAIYNKTKPTTRSVRRQSKWPRTWATQCCLNCSRRTLRRSAKNVCHIGVKASSIAHTDIDWKKLWPIEVSLQIRWTFLHSQNTSSRRGDFMVTDMGKLQKKNIILSTTWKRDVSRRISKGSTIVSYVILIFEKSCSNMIEMKKLVSNGTILQDKISPIKCQNHNIFITDKIRSSPKGLDTPLRNLSNFNQALFTSNSLHKESGERPFRPMPYWKYKERHPSSSSSSSWWQWIGSWWFSQKKSKKVDERRCMQMFMMERDNLFFYRFFDSTSDELFKDNTSSKDPFPQCEQLQGIHTQVQSPYVGTLTMTVIMARIRRATSTRTCWTLTLPQHVNTHHYTNWRLVSFFFVRVSSWLLLFLLSVDDSLSIKWV